MQDETEYETDSEDEVYGQQLLKPVFVPKADREVHCTVKVVANMGLIILMPRPYNMCILFCFDITNSLKPFRLVRPNVCNAWCRPLQSVNAWRKKDWLSRPENKNG